MTIFQDLLEPDHLFLRRDALQAGLDDRDLTRAVRAGVLVRVRHGAYAQPQHLEQLDERAQHVLRARAIVRASRVEVTLSHVSALAVLGAPLWGLPLDAVHVTKSPTACGRRETGIVPHASLLGEGDVVVEDGLRITSPARAGVEVTTMTDVEHALVVVNWLLHSGATTKAELGASALDLRHHRGTLSTDLTLRLAQDRSESVGESRVFYLCWRFGLPRPQVNYEVRNRRGRVIARVDLAWPELGVFLEFDGKVKYMRHRREGEDAGDVVVRERQREERICNLTGWRCIRLTWSDLSRPKDAAVWIASVLKGAAVYDNPLSLRRV